MAPRRSTTSSGTNGRSATLGSLPLGIDKGAPGGGERSVLLAEKEAVLATGKPGFFTIPHFDGYAAVLIQLRAVRKRALEESLTDAWLARAPAALADDYLLARHGRSR